MFTDSLGNVHWEFWEGIALNGRHFESVALFEVCRKHGTWHVKSACIATDKLPYDNDLSEIEKYIERSENALV